MKEASGELNMTLITIIAIAAIAGLFFIFKDKIVGAIDDKWDETTTCIKYNTDGTCAEHSTKK